jgi:putative membrane-bound dehydrogenase-like protein
VAGDLGLRFPMFGAFADDGRLFVAESSGNDLYAELQAGAKNSRIWLLEDVDGDGNFDKATIFADKLVCPMGLAWRDGKLFVADPPEVVVFTDDNADGRADQRQAILSRFGHQTNGSLHGLVFGPDGLLYMTMGSPDGYSLTARDGTILKGNSGALIRSRPDGSDPEVLCRGFVNLIEVAFTARGDIIGTDNWFQKPTGGMRDALVHLVEGGLYPYLSDSGTQYPNTGVALPPVGLYPAVAASGLVCYRGSAFPRMRGDLFTAQFNARKVVRHTLVPHGSSFRTVDEDFLTTEDPDFHPSDVVESADGSLLVIDTGSWYTQHCPTGQIREVDAPGGIYRIQYSAAVPVSDPWGREVHPASMSPAKLTQLLEDPRPNVRERAELALAAGGARSVTALASLVKHGKSLIARRHAIRALAQIRDKSALAALHEALDSAEPDIVTTSVRAIASHGDRSSVPFLERLLTDGHAPVRLAAAEALARVGNPSTVPVIWQSLSAQNDAFLDHALIHAAHRLADAASLQQALQDPSPKVQAAALRLLDQPPRPPGVLSHEPVFERFNASDPELRRAAREILGRHPEWAGDCADLLAALLTSPTISRRDELDLGELVLAFQADESIQELVATAIRNESGAIRPERSVLVLDIICRATLPALPKSWVDALASALDQAQPQVQMAAVRCVAVLQIGALDDQLEALANSLSEPIDLRREALRAIAERRKKLKHESFRLLIDDISNDADPLRRLAAAEVFGRLRLDAGQLSALLRKIQGEALITPAVMLPMLERSTTRETSSVVLAYLEDAVRSGWRPMPDVIADLLEQLAESDRLRLENALETALTSAPEMQSRLAEYLLLLDGGNVERGRTVFLSSKTACTTCHRVGTEGGRIGPDLTRIGAIRAGRDIVESIVFPSSTIAQGYEQYAAVTTDGRTISGIMTREANETIVLHDSSGAETRLRRDRVEEMSRQTASIMPERLEQQLSPQEFRDLLAYLQSLR